MGKIIASTPQRRIKLMSNNGEKWAIESGGDWLIIDHNQPNYERKGTEHIHFMTTIFLCSF
uniref:Uncharacterized protein n=1 Tax=Cucumis melo TaxID=3656 RepID=A0A9I9DMA2_CUCME